MDGQGIGRKRNDNSDAILELTAAGNNSEIMEVRPVKSNQQGTDGRVKNKSPRKVEKQSLLTPEERESNETHNSSGGQKKSFLSRLIARRRKKKVKPLGNQKNDGLEEKRGAMMVVSVLIATLTYQAALNPPGGFWQEDKTNGSANNSTATVPSSGEDDNHTAGTAINAKIRGFQLFLIANTVALFASLVIILILTSAVNIRRRIMMWVLMIIMWISVFSVAFSFLSGVVIILLRRVTNPAENYLIAFGLGCVGLFAVLVLLHTFIGLKEIYRWLKEKISPRENVDPVSHSPSNGTT